MSVGSLPSADELEVSLFGPGIGECVVVHLGGGEWMVVDSCIDPGSHQPVALEYFSALGVDVRTAVKYVVVSHWHDDHTRGIARVLDAAISSEVICSAALRREEFKQLVAMSRLLNLKNQASSGIDELANVLAIVKTRREGGRAIDAGPRWVHADTLIHRRVRSGEPECEVFALSPSPSTLTRSFHEINKLLPKAGGTKRAIVNVEPNDTAVVLGVRLGDAVAVLGSDLEAGSSPSAGWGAVLTTKSRPDRTGRIFKVPHHGSENAHHQGQWAEVLAPAPAAIVTPYATGRKPLPTEADIARLKRHAGQVYVTAPPPRKATLPDAMVQRTVKEVAKVMRTRGSRMGHIRVRLGAKTLTPRIELFGAAFAA